MTSLDRSNKMVISMVVCMDIITINLLMFIFQYLWQRFNGHPLFSEGSLMENVATISFSYLIGVAFSGVVLYHRRIRPDQIVISSLKNMAAFFISWLIFVSIFCEEIMLSKVVVVYFIFTTIVVIAFRLIYRSMLVYGRFQGRNTAVIVYLGSGFNMVELYEEMNQRLTTGYKILGYFDDEPNLNFNDKCIYLGKGSEIMNFLSNNNVDRVYCGLNSAHSATIVPVINYCESHMVRFYHVPNLRNYCHRRVTLEMFSNVPLLSIREEPLHSTLNRLTKRFFDIVFSLGFLCTLYIPLYAVVALITKCTSKGPVIFKQTRHGLDGREFLCYKFRSMKVNSNSDTLQATADDPRKTRFGDFLRRTSIDELPQFYNVLKGDMSVVGPRPHMVKHTQEYSQLINTYMVRHYIRPGVTGWAQVTGFRGETKELKDMKDRVKADIWYIEHWTFMLDLYVIYKTIVQVVFRRDKQAY